MYVLKAQGFDSTNLPILDTGNDRPFLRANGRMDGGASFSHALERASAKETRIGKQEDDLGQQTVVEQNRTGKKSDEPTVAAPVREHRVEKEQEVDQNTAASPQSSAQPPEVAAGSALEQATAATAATATEAPEHGGQVTVSWTGSGDDVKVSAQGLPEHLLTALLSAFGSIGGTAQGLTLETRKQTADSALDAGGLESVSGSGAKFTLKLALDPTDALQGMHEIASVIQAFTEALQKKVSNLVELLSGQTRMADLKGSNPFAQLLLREAPADGAPTTQGLTAPSRDLFSQLSIQGAQTATNGSAGPNGLDLIPNSGPELKLPRGTDLTESLLSKVKVTMSLPGAVEAANGTTEKGAGALPEGNGKSGFGEQGATMQASVQRQEPLVESSNTTSFGSIVADRLAAVAEQVGLREKPLDITLRLKMEGGESLLVGLKDQAGKIIIQVRCADEHIINLLELQKETIVRHLEAKQISSTISVSPIEEDLTRRQGREQPKNLWGRRREPSNRYTETLI